MNLREGDSSAASRPPGDNNGMRPIANDTGSLTLNADIRSGCLFAKLIPLASRGLVRPIYADSSDAASIFGQSQLDYPKCK